MPRLLRVHFASVGHPAARLDPLTLDFRGEDEPAADTVLWLRNGGGKSSVLNLLFSLLRPNQNEFLGKTVDGQSRRLVDYVKADDLACIAAEWALDGHAPGKPPAVRVVGQVMAWRGGQRSSDAGRLQRLFFSFLADGELGLDDLPTKGTARGTPALSIEAFRDWLRERGREVHVRELVHEENQARWGKHLEDLGLDPEVFRYQLEMNRREGAADELFKFGSAAAFVDFFLEIALDTTHADQVAASLEGMRAKLLRRPELALELELALEAQRRLGPLVEHLASRDRAAASLSECEREIGQTRGAFEAASARAATESAEARGAIAELTEQRRLAENEERKAKRWEEGLTALALELRAEEAKTSAEKAREKLASAQRRRARLDAVEPLRSLERVERTLAQIRELLEREESERRPHLEALAALGDALRARLAGAVEEAFGRAEGETARAEEAEEAEQAAQSARRAADSAATRAEARIEQIDQKLVEREKERERLRERGVLELREAPEDARRRHEGELDRSCAALNEAEEEADAASAELGALASQLQGLGEELGRVRQSLREAEARAREAADAREAIETLEPLTELEELDRADVFAHELEARLRAFAGRLDEQRLASAVEGSEDERGAAALEASGLFPPPLDVERVVARLREEGVEAHASFAYLAENVADDVRAKRGLVEADPAGFSGVMVPAEQLPAVRALEGLGEGLRSPVRVVARALTAPSRADEPGLTVTPRAAGAYDYAEAVRERSLLDERRARRAAESQALASRAESYRAAAQRVGEFVGRYGDGRYEAVLERAPVLRGELERLEGDRDEAEHGRERAEAKKLDAESRAAEARDHVTKASDALSRLDDFIERIERHVPGLREERGRLKEALDESRRAAEGWREKAEEARERAIEHRLGRERATRDARALERERGAIEHRSAEDLPATEEGTLERARHDYEDARRRYEREFGQSALEAELGVYEAQRVEAEKKLAVARGEYSRQDLESLSEEVGDRLDALRAEAAADVAEATNARADADAEQRAAEAALANKPRRKRETDDLPPGYVPSTSANATAAAESQREAASRANERAAELRVRLEQVERDVEAIESLARALVEHSALLWKVCEVPPASSAPFAGGEADAKALFAELIEAHRARKRTLEEATRDAEKQAQEVARLAHESKFAKHESAWKQRLLDPFDELATRAGDHLRHLKERIAVLEDELSSIDKERATLLDSFASVATEGVRLLGRLEKVSQMPASLGEWAGHPFLRVKLDVPESTEEKRARLQPLLDELVQQARIPGGLALVQRAVRHLQGAREIEAQILKPDAMRRRTRLPIASMSNWSGGERLTAAILLYCTLVNLRAHRRGLRDAGSNVLILDNPIGTCSNVALIDLQRTVARAMHTQLVYTTGVDDLAALAQLPNVIRLRNQHVSRRTGDGHVTVEGEPALESARILAREVAE